MDKRHVFDDIRLEGGNLTVENSVSKPSVDVDKMNLREQISARYLQDTRFRRYLANWVMIIVPIWLVLVIAIISLCGFTVMSLNDSVLITLLATTTANVLGLAYIVLKGIFRDNPNL